MPRNLPLVVILGATGSGKTKLSLEIAKRFTGEIISADSMQVYKGLDVITAKATKAEQNLAPHHLLDVVHPEQAFSVVEYRNAALEIIDRLFGESRLPVVVGGTNYYIESLLWRILVDTWDKTEKCLPLVNHHLDHTLPNEELYEKLVAYDPNMAKRLHPNNRRKILRSLEVFYLKGKKHSEILAEQQKETGGSPYGGGLRYPNALILRLQCEQQVLDERLNKRVDAMIEQGLVDELLDFHLKYNENRLKNNDAPNYTKGIFQSIGFKEFHPYLTMPELERNTEQGIKQLNECISNLKMATRRYARKQNKWTNNRFLARRDRSVPPMYGLDVTNVEMWQQNVTEPAFDIIDAFINKSTSNYAKLEPIEAQSQPNSMDDSFNCDVCDRRFIGAFQWELHRKSHRHRRVVERRRKEAKKAEAVIQVN